MGSARPKAWKEVKRGVLSIKKAGSRPVSARSARGGVRDTRVLGASVLLAEGASQKPQNGIRTRGSQGPDDSLGHADHMEHLCGAFKVNSARVVRAVKEPGRQATPAPVRKSKRPKFV